jgi:hypothetical protein
MDSIQQLNYDYVLKQCFNGSIVTIISISSATTYRVLNPWARDTITKEKLLFKKAVTMELVIEYPVGYDFYDGVTGHTEYEMAQHVVPIFISPERYLLWLLAS